MVINILFDFFKGGGGIIVRGFSLVIWRGVGCGWGGLKIGGQREGILWSTKYSERI